MSRARGPRRLTDALGAVREQSAPQTLLAAVQGRWATIAGEAIASEAEPVAERDGVVTVACHSATWAQELDLLAPELLQRLRSELPADDESQDLHGLRFTADAARHLDS